MPSVVFQLLSPEDKTVLMFGSLVFIISIGLAFVMGGVLPDQFGDADAEVQELPLGNGNFTASGQSSENSQSEETIPITDGIVKSITVKLDWSDEPAARPNLANQPDEFTVSIMSPYGDGSDPVTGSGGSLSSSYDVPEDACANALKNGTAQSWIVVIDCGECGDQTPPFLPTPFGLRGVSDTGNAWELTVSYNYVPFEEEE